MAVNRQGWPRDFQQFFGPNMYLQDMLQFWLHLKCHFSLIVSFTDFIFKWVNLQCNLAFPLVNKEPQQRQVRPLLLHWPTECRWGQEKVTKGPPDESAHCSLFTVYCEKLTLPQKKQQGKAKWIWAHRGEKPGALWGMATGSLRKRTAWWCDHIPAIEAAKGQLLCFSFPS
jgi:hypothetical protein